MKRHLTAALALAALCATGALAALSFAPAAFAWSPSDLPPGWSVSHEMGGIDPNCQDAYRIWNTDHSDFSNPFCTASPTYQQDFDAWVNARYTPPPATTTATPTTAAVTTTAPTATTTTPATTTTVTPAGTTTAAPATPPPSTTTVTAAAPPAAAPATPPVADFTAASPNPNVVTFTDTSTAGTAAITSRVWQLGDGTAAVGPSVTHPYIGPGTYMVTLIVVDATGLTSVVVHQLTIAADRSIVLGPRQTQAVRAKLTLADAGAAYFVLNPTR